MGGLLTAALLELPFVDREEELTLLKGLFNEVVTGTGQVVFVAGEGGIGKTRLVRELGRYAEANGAIFAVGPSYEDEAVVPYSPWTEIIRGIVEQASTVILAKTLGPTLAEVGRLMPELAVRAKELGIKGWLSGPETRGFISTMDAERVRLFQAVTDFLSYVSKEQPLVLLLDDVLWADPVSLQLLRYVCRRIKLRKIMVLAAYRDVELPEEHPLSRLLIDLNRERTLRQIGLGKLTPEHVAQMISNHLGGGSVVPQFVKLVHSRTGGNPFFVEEVMRSLLEDGRAYGSEQGWTLKEIEQFQIPSSVRALIKQRLSRLGDETVEILSVGSAVGMDFPYELLRRVTSQEEGRLIKLLERAVRAGLVKERPLGKLVSYVFSDEQVRDYLYTELSLIRKRKVHARIVHEMEELYRDEKDEHLEELAHHYIQADETGKAVEFSLLAGDRAAKLHAHAGAKKHYRNVLELLEEDQLDERLEALIRVGDASYQMGEHAECLRYYKDGLAIAERLKQSKKTAQLYTKLGDVNWFLGGELQQALESYKQGLNVLAGEQDIVEEARICEKIARMLVFMGDVDDGLQWGERAVKIARKMGYHEVLAHALQDLALGLSPSRDRKGEIFRHLEDSLKIAMEHEVEDAVCRAHENLAQAYKDIKSDYARAKDVCVKGLEYARSRGHQVRECETEMGLAWACIPLGEWNMVSELASQSLRICAEVGMVNVAGPLRALGMVSLLKGDLERAEDYLTRAFALAERSPYKGAIFNNALALGKLHMKKNDIDKAEHYLLKALEDRSKADWGASVEITFELVNVYRMKGDLEKAQDFYERIRGYAEELDEKWAYAYEFWARGILSSLKGDWSGANEAFTKSSELWKELHHPYHYAQTELELGRTFSHRGDIESARKCMQEAKGVFAQLGARLDSERLEEEPLLLES